MICLRRRRGGPLWPPAGFGTGFIPRGGFRPAGRVSFPSIGKKPKDRRGRLTSPSETSSLRLQFVLPRTPRLRGIPLYPSARFPARKIRFRASFLPGHRALMRCKIPACTISPLRLVPTSRGRGCRSGCAGRIRPPRTVTPVGRDDSARRLTGFRSPVYRHRTFHRHPVGEGLAPSAVRLCCDLPGTL